MFKTKVTRFYSILTTYLMSEYMNTETMSNSICVVLVSNMSNSYA